MWKALVALIIVAVIVTVGFLKPSQKQLKKPKYEVVRLDNPPESQPSREPTFDQAEFEAGLIEAFGDEAAKRKATHP